MTLYYLGMYPVKGLVEVEADTVREAIDIAHATHPGARVHSGVAEPGSGVYPTEDDLEEWMKNHRTQKSGSERTEKK